MIAFELTYLEKHRRTVHAASIEEAGKLARQFLNTLNVTPGPEPDYKLLSILPVAQAPKPVKSD